MSEESESVRIAALIEKQDELVTAVKEIAVGVSALLQFQAAQTARNEADRDWRTRVEKHQDLQDQDIKAAEKIAIDAKNQALSNGKWINIGVAILTGILIFVGQKLISLIGA